MASSLTTPRKPWVLPTGHWLLQAWSWLVFMFIVITAWLIVMVKVLNKLDEDTSQQVRAKLPLRRTYLIALCAYANAQVWGSMLYNAVMVYVGLTIVFIIASFVPPSNIEGYPKISQFLNSSRMNLQRLLDPRNALGWLEAHHMAAHAFVFVLMLCVPVLPILLYMHNNDLKDVFVARAKVLRVLFIMPIMWIVAYAVYSGLCIAGAFEL